MSTTSPSKKMIFVAKRVSMGDKLVIYVPKAYHQTLKQLQNPLKITAEEII